MAPTSYSEWCSLMDEISTSPRNEDYIQLIRQGSISWTSGVAERFIQCVANTLKKRINAAQDVYQRQMHNSMGTDIGISRALSVLAKEYRYLYQLASALPIPAEHMQQMRKLIQDQADQTHQNLMDSARADRTGKLAAIVRSAGVNKL